MKNVLKVTMTTKNEGPWSWTSPLPPGHAKSLLAPPPLWSFKITLVHVLLVHVIFILVGGIVKRKEVS